MAMASKYADSNETKDESDEDDDAKENKNGKDSNKTLPKNNDNNPTRITSSATALMPAPS